jgi:hypothetical protein
MQPFCVLQEKPAGANPHEGVLRGAMLTSVCERCQAQPTKRICSALKNVSGHVLVGAKGVIIRSNNEMAVN